MPPRRFASLILPWLPAAAALWFAVQASPPGSGVRFAVYRPSTAQFHLDRGVMPGGSVDYAHDAKETIPFGAPGDAGFVCPQRDREDARGFRTWVAGRWYFSAPSRRPPHGDLELGQPGDLPFCADFDGDGIADSGVFRDGGWQVATRRSGRRADIRFSFGATGDRPVVLNVAGAGNATDRRNVVYGVYRGGAWYLDTRGTGAADATHYFGGLPQDVPLLIPRWVAGGADGYSLAIFRDGTWFIRPAPDGPVTLSFPFGQAGDLPGFAR